MAYHFQDLDGKWRMRYDDGTTSLPIDTIGSHRMDSSKEIDDSDGKWRESYGVDNSFKATQALVNSGMPADRVKELQNAIVDSEMSNARIATYANEFQPLAEHGAAHHDLISQVAANTLADSEMRAGAFQALYPGMEVTVGPKGDLHFQAMGSDLGFAYPDKVKAKSDQLKRQGFNGDTEDPMAKLGTIISAMRGSGSSEEIGRLQGDALALYSEAKAKLEEDFKADLGVDFRIDHLKRELEQSHLIDRQARLRHAAMGQHVPVDSPVTIGIRQSLVLEEQALQAKVDERLEADPTLQALKAQLAVVNTIAQDSLGKELATPELLPDGVAENFGPIWNKDGPMTVAQHQELAKKISANDPYAIALVNLAGSEAKELLLNADSVGAAYRPIIQRMFDAQAGEEGVFDRLMENVKEFEDFQKQFNITLTKPEQNLMDTPKGANFSTMGSEDKAAILKQIEELKVNKVLEVAKRARDGDWHRSVLNTDIVPDLPEEYAAYWKVAKDYVFNEKVESAKKKLEPGFFSSPKEKLDLERQRRELDKNPWGSIDITVGEVAARVAVLAKRDKPRHMTDFDVIDVLGKSLGDWVELQAKDPKLGNVFPSILGTSKSEIQSSIINAYHNTPREVDTHIIGLGNAPLGFGI